MKRKSIKLVFIAASIVLAISLTACVNDAGKQNDTTHLQENPIEETINASELQAAIEAYEYDQIPFMDGTVVSKNDATWGYLNEETHSNVIGFDFAFMRYAQPIYLDTDNNPDLYDFENFYYNREVIPLLENTEYFKATAGQKLKNGLTVTKTLCKVPVVFDDGAHISENEIFLDGSITVEGVLEYFDQDEYVITEGSVMFYPNPLSADYLPVAYESSYTYESVDLNGKFAFANDGARFLVGNINEMSVDISDYFENKSLVKVRAVLTDIVLRYDEGAGGNMSSAVLTDVELAE